MVQAVVVWGDPCRDSLVVVVVKGNGGDGRCFRPVETVLGFFTWLTASVVRQWWDVWWNEWWDMLIFDYLFNEIKAEVAFLHMRDFLQKGLRRLERLHLDGIRRDAPYLVKSLEVLQACFPQKFEMLQAHFPDSSHSKEKMRVLENEFRPLIKDLLVWKIVDSMRTQEDVALFEPQSGYEGLQVNMAVGPHLGEMEPHAGEIEPHASEIKPHGLEIETHAKEVEVLHGEPVFDREVPEYHPDTKVYDCQSGPIIPQTYCEEQAALPEADWGQETDETFDPLHELDQVVADFRIDGGAYSLAAEPVENFAGDYEPIRNWKNRNEGDMEVFQQACDMVRRQQIVPIPAMARADILDGSAYAPIVPRTLPATAMGQIGTTAGVSYVPIVPRPTHAAAPTRIHTERAKIKNRPKGLKYKKRKNGTAKHLSVSAT